MRHMWIAALVGAGCLGVAACGPPPTMEVDPLTLALGQSAAGSVNSAFDETDTLVIPVPENTSGTFTVVSCHTDTEFFYGFTEATQGPLTCADLLDNPLPFSVNSVPNSQMVVRVSASSIVPRNLEYKIETAET